MYNIPEYLAHTLIWAILPHQISALDHVSAKHWQISIKYQNTDIKCKMTHTYKHTEKKPTLINSKECPGKASPE